MRITAPRALILVPVLASLLVLAGLSEASAQFAPAQPPAFPPPPGQQQQASPFPAPGNSAFPVPPGQSMAPRPATAGPPGKHPCEAFMPIRQDAEKVMASIRAAGSRKAAREEVCPLFRQLVSAETKMLKFMETNKALCNVPAEAIKQVKDNHTKTMGVTKNVCSSGPAGPSGPSLSDALGAPLVPSEPPKPGRGTFDTLTGNVLAR